MNEQKPLCENLLSIDKNKTGWMWDLKKVELFGFLEKRTNFENTALRNLTFHVFLDKRNDEKGKNLNLYHCENTQRRAPKEMSFSPARRGLITY